MRASQENTTNPTASDTTIPTAGRILEDGTLIELVEDLTQPGGVALLKWDGRRSVVAPSAQHGGKTYVPVTLDPSLRNALRLPPDVLPIESTAQLCAELVAVTQKYTNLPEHNCFMLVFFIFASWLTDCLPAPINLALWSPVATRAARVLLLLGCLCRQALALSGTSARDLTLLPPELRSTLLIFRPASGRRTREVLSTCGWSGFHSARAGQFSEFIGSIALATDNPLKERCLGPMIEIALGPGSGPLPILDARAQRELAKEFQPKLLMYRLVHHEAAARVESAEAAFADPGSQLTPGICACFSDDSALRDLHMRLLIEVGPNGYEERFADPRVPLIEILLARCHEQCREKVYVAEITADLNALLSVSGDVRLTSRMVGSLLKGLGVRTLKLDRLGRGIKLDQATRNFLHQLARVHDVSSAAAPFAGCPECSQRQPTGS